MKRVVAIHALGALLVVGSATAWLTTGREGYTRWPDAKLAQSDAPPSEIEDDLLSDIGFVVDDDLVSEPDIESRFAFGLAPGGFDPKHLPSLATFGALAIALSSVTALTHFRRSRSQRSAE